MEINKVCIFMGENSRRKLVDIENDVYVSWCVLFHECELGRMDPIN